MLITPRGVLTRATHAEAIPVLTAFIERLQSMGAARTEGPRLLAGSSTSNLEVSRR